MNDKPKQIVIPEKFFALFKELFSSIEIQGKPFHTIPYLLREIYSRNLTISNIDSKEYTVEATPVTDLPPHVIRMLYGIPEPPPPPAPDPRINLLDSFSARINIGDVEYSFMPAWIMKTKDGKMTPQFLGALPQDLRDRITELRSTIPEKKEFPRPYTPDEAEKPPTTTNA